MNLDIPTISADVIQRWRDRGIEVSDHEGKCDSENIQMLIGADFASTFMHDQKEVEGEVAWRTSFGWVLSGVVRPSENAPSDAKLEAVNVHLCQIRSKRYGKWKSLYSELIILFSP